MKFQITVRHGRRMKRYLTLEVEAVDAAQALRAGAGQIPPEVAPEVDLVELRVAPDPDKDRPFVEGS